MARLTLTRKIAAIAEAWH